MKKPKPKLEPFTPKMNAAWHGLLENQYKRRILFDGGRRSTKTVLMTCWLLSQMQRYAGLRVLIVRRTREAAYRSIWAQTIHPLIAGRPDFAVNLSRLEITYTPNGSMIMIDGIEDQERVDKILGTEWGHIFFNEATQNSWETTQMVLSSLAQSVRGMPVRKALFDCNPKSQRHWLYQVGVKNVDPATGEPLRDAATWGRQHWTPYDNPWLAADVLATYEALVGTRRRRLLLGEWCESEGAVYEEFDEDIHVWRGKMPDGFEYWPRVRGVDFGFQNPFVCLWGALDGDGRLWIYRERYVTGKTVEEHCDAIREHDEPIEWTVADHDHAARETMHARGIPTWAALKDKDAGVNAVHERLKLQLDGRPRIFVHESCKDTIAEFYDYAWRPAREGMNAKDEPEKARDHAMDAIRYMVMQADKGTLFARAVPVVHSRVSVEREALGGGVDIEREIAMLERIIDEGEKELA